MVVVVNYTAAKNVCNYNWLVTKRCMQWVSFTSSFRDIQILEDGLYLFLYDGFVCVENCTWEIYYGLLNRFSLNTHNLQDFYRGLNHTHCIYLFVQVLRVALNLTMRGSRSTGIITDGVFSKCIASFFFFKVRFTLHYYAILPDPHLSTLARWGNRHLSQTCKSTHVI